MTARKSQIFRDDLLSGRVCVVSGAGTNIGRAISLELSALGATVVGCGRRLELVEETAEMIRDGGGSAWAARLDVRDDEAVNGFFDDVLERYGRVDALVNNAGGQFVAPAEQTTPKGFRHVVDLNLGSTYLMTHTAALKAFIPQRSGRVINISAAPHTGAPGVVHNSAARAAIENMTKTLSLEWGRFGIKLCSIAIGVVDNDVIRAKYQPEYIEKFLKVDDIALGRLGRPEEVGWLAAYLCSDAADYITGSVINLDGGKDNGRPVHDAPPQDERPPRPEAH